MAGQGKGNIRLIDPNEVVSRLPNSVNGTPQYEKMFIFAELIATRRGRSALVNSGTGVSQQRDGLENNIDINMLGFDQDTHEFTTKWSKNTALSENPYEGFGIADINVKINSSFVPEININFIDIRGMAFANKGKDSPYTILFDFPPALFKLTLKGYYGRSLTYDLHLVKYNVAFDASTGNYNISSQFIARTFAPLTDVLFKYTDIFPLMDIGTAELPVKGTNDISSNVRFDTSNYPNEVMDDPRIPPKNTHELIKQLEALYDKISIQRNDSDIAEAYKDSLSAQKQAEDISGQISRFSGRLNVDLQKGAIMGIIDNDVDVEADDSYFRRIVNINEYHTVIKSLGEDAYKPDFDQRLYLLVKRFDETTTGSTEIAQENLENRDKLIRTALQTERLYLLQLGQLLDETISPDDTSKDITATVPTNGDYNPQKITGDSVVYYGIDVTQYYQKVYKKWVQKKKDSDGKREELVNSINELVFQDLGMKPTIYNIFKILCDDVDRFFNSLKKSAIAGERHHEEYMNQIITRPNIKDKKIGAYPRYTKPNTTNNTTREARHIPDTREFPNIEKFPEVQLVDDFINAFIDIEKREDVRNLRTQVDPRGNNIWIPVTPADSLLYNELDYNSPYFNLYGLNSESALNQIFQIALNRFYTASQYTYAHDFYIRRDNVSLFKNSDVQRKKLIKYVAGAEAVNLANSLSEQTVSIALKNKSKEFFSNINAFYDELKQRKIPNFALLNNNTTSPFLPLSNLDPIYRRRDNPNFEGIKILSVGDMRDVSKRKELDSDTSSDDNTNVVDIYMSEQTGFFDDIFDYIFGRKEIEEFTAENVPYFKDEPLDDNFSTNHVAADNFVKGWTNFLGHQETSLFGSDGKQNDLRFKEILEADEVVIPSTGYTKEAKSFFIVSNVSSSYGVMNDITRVDNPSPYKKFVYPTLNELPKFAVAYVGGLINYNQDAAFKAEVDRFYEDDAGITYTQFGLDNIENEASNLEQISTGDSKLFLEFFTSFTNDINEYGRARILFTQMITNVNEKIETDDLSNFKKFDLYDDALRESEVALSDLLNERMGILNTSQLTFYDGDSEGVDFTPLALITGGTTIAGQSVTSTEIVTYNNMFFQEFFRVLGNKLDDRIRKQQNREIEIRGSIEDEDVRTQTYYSFKSITDKWLAGENNAVNGYPFNRGESDTLIEKFMFVDRAMNPIGDDCVIDVEPLINMSKDYDINFFNVITRLLSHNGFEFFPLQNFMSFQEDEWDNVFKIYESANKDATPAFVCMYIGGTATTLNNDTGAFDDDGIDSLDNVKDLPDFSGSKEFTSQEVVDKQNTISPRKYPYAEVRAFRVRYAEQNQSFFKNIQIDSREFPETNESLSILSKIAGDESSTSPVPKGQNLFNVYENRSYSSSVEMLGNMMIQPTQYFQLENVPIFNGAYLVVNVEHNIVPNHATTSFTGVRILKYPNPIVTDFATAVGFQGGTATDLSGVDPTSEFAYGQTGAGSVPAQAQHDSMYKLQLRPEGELDSE